MMSAKKTIIVFFVALIALGQAATTRADVLSGLVGRYSLEDTSVAGKELNSATSTWDATDANTANMSRLVESGNTYLNFAGGQSGGYIVTPKHLSGEDSFTLSVWFRFTDASVSKKMVCGEGAYTLSVESAGGGYAGKIRYKQNAGGSWSGDSDLLSDAAPSTGAWHHVAITYDGSTALMYLDGVLQVKTLSDSGTLATASGEYIAAYAAAHTEKWKGDLDEVRYYNRALSGTEVGSVYAAGVPEPATATLVAAGLAGILARRRRRG